MNLSQEQTQTEQFTTRQLINETEPLTNETFIEAELSSDDLKQIVGGALSVDLGGTSAEL